MGGKNSKRETPYGSTSPRGSPNSSKVSRTRSLPTRVFSRRLSYDHGGSLKGRAVLEDLEDTDHLEEYQKLLELEKLHGKANNSATAAGFCGGTSHDIIRSCISPLRGSREEVIYEEGDDDNVADGSESSSKDSPPLSRFAARGRLSSFSAPCLAELVSQVEGLGDCSDGNIQDPILAKPFLSAHNSPAVKEPEEVAAQLTCYAHDPLAPEFQSDDIKCKTSGQSVRHLSQLTEKFEEEVAEAKHTASVVIEASPLSEDKGNNSHVSEDQHDTALKVTSPASKEFVLRILSGVPGSGTVYKFQAQKTPAGRRRWRRTSRCSCDQDPKTPDEGGKMSGKGKVSLSFTNSGKRLKDSRRNSFNDANDIVWGATSAGKRIKDGIGEETVPSDMHPDAFAWGLMGQSDPFLGFDAAGFFTQLPDEEEQAKGGGGFTRRSRTPSKASRGKALARKVRGLRASPKPVSSLESCLRAQLTDENGRERGRQVSRPLNFSPPADGRGRPENGLKMIGYINGVPTSPDVTPINNNSAVGSERRSSSSSSVSLPNLQKVLKGFAARLAPNKVDSNSDADEAGPKQAAVEMPAGCPGNSQWKKSLLPVILKKRKISDVKHLSVGSDQGSDKLHVEELSLSSKEALLFGFGVGVGVQSASEAHQAEVQRLNQLLDEAQIQMQNLKLELESRGGSASLAGGRLDQGAIRYTHDGTVSYDLESQDQGDQMAELEAELEAELDQLTGGDSVLDSQYSVLDELDMDGVASVVYGDLKVAGLPARLEESSEDDDYSVPAQPACLNNYAVSPRLLARLLRKVQATRQEELLTELEEELEGAQSKLQSKEEELEVWKDRVRHLMEGSLTSTSGDEIPIPGKTNAAKTSVERSKTPNQKNVDDKTGVKGIDSLEGQESSHFPLQGASTRGSGNEADTNITGPGGSSDNPVVVTSGVVETTKEDLQTDVKQNRRDTERYATPGITVPAGDETCNEFLQSMIDDEEFGSSSHAEAMTTQASRDCSQVMDNAQIERQLIDSVQGLEKSDYPESSEMGSATPSVCDYSSTGSLADGWDHSVDPASFQATTSNGDTGGWFRRGKLLVPHPSRRTSWNSDAGQSILVRKVETEEGPVSPKAESCTAIVKYTENLESSKSVSEMSDSDMHYSVKYEDASGTTRPIADSGGTVPVDRKAASFWEGGGRAGLNTPVEKEKVKVRQQLFKPSSREGAGLGLGFNLPTQRPLCLEGRSGDLSPTVLDKIARWEGLMEGETPGPATGSDWECQSRASESEQCNLELVDDDINVFGEENLVLEAEEMLGRMLINRIVEKTRAGSHIVKEAQTALASLERDDGGGGGGGGGGKEDAEMNGRMTDSDTSTLSERDYDSREEGWSDDQRKETSNSFLDEAVRQEYEFFRRLELISRDRKAAKTVKEKPVKEPAYLGRLDLQHIPSLDLDASEPAFRTKEASGILASVQETDSPLKEIRGINRSAEKKSRSGENWLVRGEARQELYGGSGYREDEVRSRRRL